MYDKNVVWKMFLFSVYGRIDKGIADTATHIYAGDPANDDSSVTYALPLKIEHTAQSQCFQLQVNIDFFIYTSFLSIILLIRELFNPHSQSHTVTVATPEHSHFPLTKSILRYSFNQKLIKKTLNNF